MRIASAASSNWLLHAPSSKSVYTSTLGGGYLLNQLVPEVRKFFQNYVRANYNSDDGLLMDSQSPSLAQELYYSTCGCSTTREIPTNQMLQAAHDHMASAMTHRNGAPFIQANNSLPGNPYLPQRSATSSRPSPRCAVKTFQVRSSSCSPTVARGTVRAKFSNGWR